MNCFRYTRNLVDEGNGKFNLIVLCWGEGQGRYVSSCVVIHRHLLFEETVSLFLMTEILKLIELKVLCIVYSDDCVFLWILYSTNLCKV